MESGRPPGPPPRRVRRRSARLPALLIAALVTGCGSEPAAVAVECAVETLGPAGSADPRGPRTASDTIDVLLHVGAAPPSGSVRLMVRVDPLSEPGAVTFGAGTPGTAAAVAVALTERAVFHGCLGEAPSGFRLTASAAPRGRAWLRVSADRPVAVRLTVGEEDAGGRAAVVSVGPGGSAATSWVQTP